MPNLESTKSFIVRHGFEPKYGLIKLSSTFHVGHIDASFENSLDLWNGRVRHEDSVPQATIMTRNSPQELPRLSREPGSRRESRDASGYPIPVLVSSLKKGAGGYDARSA